MRRSWSFRTAVALAAALVLTACGTQLPDSAFTTSAQEGPAADATGAVAAVAGDDTPLAGGDIVAGDATTADATGAATASGSRAASSGSGSGTKAATAVGTGKAPGGKANTASDVGVTANAIKIGNITTVGGPMPGQFEPWLLGLRVWVNEINGKGGINGRKIQLVPCDDAMDSERNKTCARDLIENQKVFALVGTNTPAMPSAKYINDKKVPAVGVAPIGNYTSFYPYWFSAYGMNSCPRNGVDDPDKPGYCRGSPKGTDAGLRYYKEQVGVTKAAVFWHNIDISKQAGLDTAYALEQAGIKVVYTGETQVAEPDYTGHVLQMKDRGVEGVWDTMEINNNIRLLQAMDRQGWAPKAKVSTIAVYGQDIGAQVPGPSKNSLFVSSTTRAYTDLKHPPMANFVKLFDRFFPNKKKHAWNVDGYRGALMFGDAVEALGPNVTREGMVKWLNSVTDYDPDGLGRPIDYKLTPASEYEKPRPDVSCFAVARYQKTDFFNTPGGDWKCIQGAWTKSRPD